MIFLFFDKFCGQYTEGGNLSDIFEYLISIPLSKTYFTKSVKELIFLFKTSNIKVKQTCVCLKNEVNV